MKYTKKIKNYFVINSEKINNRKVLFKDYNSENYLTNKFKKEYLDIIKSFF